MRIVNFVDKTDSRCLQRQTRSFMSTRKENCLKTVCPHCNSKFCEPYFKKKHIQFEHQEVPFKCDHCISTFHAKKSKEYHEAVHHSDVDQTEKCDICGNTFAARISLQNHQKYVHSDNREHECSECDFKFKQRKDMEAHFFNIHNFNLQKELYGQPVEAARFQCEVCDASFKYRKGLNAHIRSKHGPNNEPKKTSDCDECPSKFKEKKNLNAHKKTKHGNYVEEFPCPTCHHCHPICKLLPEYLEKFSLYFDLNDVEIKCKN